MLADCYVLVDSRSNELVQGFVAKFCPQCEETTDQYRVTCFTHEPEIVFKTAGELMVYCERFKFCTNKIVWRPLNNGSLKQAMVVYTEDGEMIFGLAVDAGEKSEDGYLDRMMEYLKSDVGYIAYDQPPVEPASEFRKIVHTIRTGRK
jgi:hypothetical protein